jgi:hypothetical protein
MSFPFFGPVTWQLSGGLQGLVNCKSDEVAFYAYGGFGLGLGTPGVSVSLNAVFVWNLPNAQAYTGKFWNVNIGGNIGAWGGNVQGFTADFTDFVTGTFKEAMGFEVGWQGGATGFGAAFNFQWFVMLGRPIRLNPNSKLISTLCQSAAGAQPLNRGNLPARAATIKAFDVKTAFELVLAEGKLREEQIKRDFAAAARDELVRRRDRLIRGVPYARALRNFNRQVFLKWATWGPATLSAPPW